MLEVAGGIILAIIILVLLPTILWVVGFGIALFLGVGLAAWIGFPAWIGAIIGAVAYVAAISGR